MATNEGIDLSRLLARIRADVGPLPAGSGSQAISTKDYIGLVQAEYRALSEKGDREERQAQLAIEERKWVLEHEERVASRLAQEAKDARDAQVAKELRQEQSAKEIRIHLRVAAYRFAMLAVVIIVAAFYFADAEQRKTVITLTLTSLFGIVTGATGYYFGNKDKKKEG